MGHFVQQSGGIPALTGLRFFAAAMIVLHHSDKGVFFDRNLFFPLHMSVGVPLFFALSGFVLTINSPRYTSVPDFYAARVARIFPAHLSTIALLATVFYPYSLALFQQPNLTTSMINVLLLQAWSPRQFYTLNAPSWSISVELFFYAIFPALILVMRQRPLQKALFAYAGMLGALVVIDLVFNPEGNIRTWIGYINPIVNVPAFMLGMAAGRHFLANDQKAIDDRAGIQFLALVVAIVSASVGGFAAHSNSATASFLTVSFATPVFAYLLYVLAAYRGPVSRFLERPTFVYLGEVSFSLYLVHQIIIRYWHDRFAPTSEFSPLVQWLIVIGASLLISIANYELVEKNCRRWMIAAWFSFRSITRPSGSSRTRLR